jgi:hypothetical protein
MDNGTDRDIDPAVVERVRRDLADLASDEASAPEVPPAVTERVITALAAQPTHSIQRPRLSRLQLFGLIVGLGAALVGAVTGVVMLTRDTAPTWSGGPTAEFITVSQQASGMPLTDDQIVALLSRAPDYGPLADPQRRASCLDGLGYSAATKLLGARPLDMAGRPAVLMLLPGDAPDAVVAMVVEPNCNAAHTGLLADTVVTRP